MNQSEFRIDENIGSNLREVTAALKEFNQPLSQRHRDMYQKLDALVDSQKKSTAALETIAKECAEIKNLTKAVQDLATAVSKR